MTPPVIQKGNWWERNWKWFLPTAIVAALAMFIGFIGLIFAIVTVSIRSSDAYKGAIASARADARVRDALGSPLKEGWFITGNLNVTGTSGRADLALPISGPKGKGTIYVIATKAAGLWTYSTLVLQADVKGTRIDLKTEDSKAIR